MRIIFVGSVLFSKVMLEKLVSWNGQVVGVITKSNSDFNSDFVNLSVISEQHGIPVKCVNDINHPNNIDWIREKKPDVIFCFGWSNLIKTELLSVAPMGVVGFHPSLLPANRGRHPLIWAKVLGLAETGCTFFFMDEGADTGDILDQQAFSIHFDDDAAMLYAKMEQTAILQMERFLPALQSGHYSKITQTIEGNSWRKRNAKDGLIDFRMSTYSICNLVRALGKPYPGAHCFFNNEEVKIWTVKPGETYLSNTEPGKVIYADKDSITVKTADGSVILPTHTFTQIPLAGDYIR